MCSFESTSTTDEEKNEKHNSKNLILCLRVEKKIHFPSIAALTVDSVASVLAPKISFGENVSVIFPASICLVKGKQVYLKGEIIRLSVALKDLCRKKIAKRFF